MIYHTITYSFIVQEHMSTNHVMTCKQYTKTQDTTHSDTYN